MEDELELFIRERKARVAQDRASLEQDPPYMEIQVSWRQINFVLSSAIKGYRYCIFYTVKHLGL
uniref:Uncharacterized protein n=1 Tax=Hippocampus comes TaxID=109280 RepID=A0A3Q2YZD8_HIPCM